MPQKTPDEIKDDVEYKEFLDNNRPARDRLKKFFFDLYDSFPDARIAEEKLRKVIITSNIIENLVQNNYLIREEMKIPQKNGRIEPRNYYTIGPNGIQLVLSWQNEKIAIRSLWASIIAATVGIIALTSPLIWNGVWEVNNLCFCWFFIIAIILGGYLFFKYNKSLN